MSSTLNFHEARKITMRPVICGNDDTFIIEIELNGDMHWCNNHTMTAFVNRADFPYFERAAKAFNDALVDFVPQPLPEKGLSNPRKVG